MAIRASMSCIDDSLLPDALEDQVDALRAENAKLRAAINEYLAWCSDPADWKGNPELLKIRSQMLSALGWPATPHK